MMNQRQVLDDFGELIMRNVVESVFSLFKHDLKRAVKKEVSAIDAERFLAKLSEDEMAVVEKIALSAIKTTTHYFLWQAEQKNFDITFEDKNVADLSDGLSGELYLEDGWFERFLTKK